MEYRDLLPAPAKQALIEAANRAKDLPEHCVARAKVIDDAIEKAKTIAPKAFRAEAL